MTDEEIWKALDGMFAYEHGFTDSGIKDVSLDKKVEAELQVDPLRLARIVRDFYLTESRLNQGYKLEDLAEFAMWADAKYG